eukprot:CAMPEP_0172626218 /NCGR_PEP_ID=MMETSP1068-20121228/148841_1 /TAXON_ID=35684 /ORGANISM="Pseudopedinella elastica, Strain CCMP716" /LENGTH=73 /DNA_ID=CAMNT_0013435773 /DNA_START=135 /DNA_END=353 /DNA_ORIENTATION=+
MPCGRPRSSSAVPIVPSPRPAAAPFSFTRSSSLSSASVLVAASYDLRLWLPPLKFAFRPSRGDPPPTATAALP